VLNKILTPFYPLPQYLRDFIKTDFELLKYGLVGVFIALSIAINYWVDFETNYVNVSHFLSRFIRYTVFYGFAYFGTVLIIEITYSKIAILKKLIFWGLSLSGILIISFDVSYRGTYTIARALVDTEVYLYVNSLFYELKNFITILIPLLIIWLFTRQHYDSFFGLTYKNIIVRPYLLLLLIMLPVIVVAAQDDSFLQAYPMFKTYGAENHWGIDKGWLVIPYESFYGSAFLPVELFYRGFLVIGLARVMGKDAILPMVCLYAFLHFEKPMGEAIGSVFGGYLLGVFAYFSKNIWGGVFVHAGIALLMEAIVVLVKI
jgi:Type II CAAX prenyl endopeptidase Rce1-like